jgi:large subunit ribosomal protein L14
MVQLLTRLVVADNSGAKELMVIQVYGGSSRRAGHLGDILGCVVKRAMPNGQYKKGDLVKVVLVRTAKEVKRADGSYVRFSENAGVIITSRENLDPIGTRVFGPIAREIRDKGFAKIASLAKNVV